MYERDSTPGDPDPDAGRGRTHDGRRATGESDGVTEHLRAALHTDDLTEKNYHLREAIQLLAARESDSAVREA